MAPGDCSHLLWLAERLLSSCRSSPRSDSWPKEEIEEAEGETLSLATDSSLKKSAGSRARRASGSCVPRLW